MKLSTALAVEHLLRAVYCEHICKNTPDKYNEDDNYIYFPIFSCRIQTCVFLWQCAFDVWKLLLLAAIMLPHMHNLYNLYI